MAEPLMPHPEQPDTVADERQDAPVREPHAEPAEEDDVLTSAGRAHTDEDRTPRFGSGERLSPEALAEETPD